MAKLMETTPAESPPETVQAPPEPGPDTNGAHSTEPDPEVDIRYFELTEPIETGGRVKQKIERLLVDSSHLSANDYFEILDRYVMEVPKEIRTRYEHEWDDSRFLKLLIIKLNPPMIDLDFGQISMGDLMPLFRQAQGLIFWKRYKKMTAKQTQSLSSDRSTRP